MDAPRAIVRRLLRLDLHRRVPAASWRGLIDPPDEGGDLSTHVSLSDEHLFATRTRETRAGERERERRERERDASEREKERETRLWPLKTGQALTLLP